MRGHDFDNCKSANRGVLGIIALGKHRLRLENVSGGGLNLDYIVFAPPFLELTQEWVEKR